VDALITLLGSELHTLVAWMGAQLMETTIPCSHCLINQINPHTFPLKQLEDSFSAGILEVPCVHSNPPVLVSLHELAPDVSLVRIPVVNWESLEVIDKLGSGAYADVFKAKDIHTGKLLAVKKLLHTNNLRDFRQEVKFMSEMKHDNLVGLIHICFSPPSINTEFMNQGTLTHFLKDISNDYSWEMCLSIARDVARGMAYLHSNKKIHLDLKSPNVLLNRNEDGSIVAKVADFGLSRNLGPTIGGRLCDNPTWLAPEIMKNEEYTEKADVYSYGIILFELLTREFPFSEYRLLFLVEVAVLEGNRPPVPIYCPPFFRTLMKQCWQEDSTKRPFFPEIIKILETKSSHITSLRTKGKYKFSDFTINSNEIIFRDEEDLAAAAIVMNDGFSLQQCTHNGSKVALPQQFLERECETLPFSSK